MCALIRILHYGSLNIKTGGPALSTYLTLTGLNSLELKTELLMKPLRQEEELIGDLVDIHYTQQLADKRFETLFLPQKNIADCGRFDLYHIQGIWDFAGHLVAAYARQIDKPYLITLRGMMYPQALQKSVLKKKIGLFFYQRKDLKKAACIHVTCVEEMEHYRKLGYTNPVAVIPNPIQTTGIDKTVTSIDKVRIGYLGRVHSRKRIERVLYAVAALKKQDLEVLIIGDGSPDYMQFLRKEAKRLQLQNVIFTGFLSGIEKEEALRKLSFLVVPSDFENFGNIITEALVKGIPVISSKGTPWQELNTHRCGWWVDNDVDTLAATLREALALPEAERVEMGERGKRLVKENYSMEMVAEKMKRLYEWILGRGDRPEFVHCL